MRLLRPLLAAIFFVFCGPALAQQVCAQLHSQLAAINQAGGGDAARYQQARAAYDAAYRSAQQMGCITVFRIFAPPQCGPVLQNLNVLGANADALARAGTTPGPPPGARAAIIAALQQNGCSGSPQRPRSDTYRTVCVRPQDGFFFPVSFATTTAQFTTDAASCEAQCVGASLFVYRNPGGTMDDAVDLEDRRYVDMPFAYLYRSSYDPAIRCELSRTVVAAIAMPEPVAEAVPSVPVPRSRPVPSEDPETLANRAGGIVISPLPPGEGPLLAANGVRLIGPAFYYAQ
ncbi:MAG: DUF2865 domain-containing protein [Bauldia sp.]|nr:DUF2865 domain-containing protein [Bauldia sp.]